MSAGEAYFYAVLISGIAFLGGLAMIADGFRLRRQRELMQDTPTEDIESASVGPTEVAGVAVPVDDPIPAPFTDDECVLATWKIEEWDEAGKSSSWDTVGDGVEAVPFSVDDGTGRLRVEADESATYELEGMEEPTLEVGVEETEPAPVTRFLGREDTPGAPVESVLSGLDVGKKHGDRRYYQALVEPGEEVYVFGTARARDEPAPTNASNLVIRDAPDDEEPMYMISDRPERELVDDRRWVMWRLPVGAVVSTLGLGGLILLLGPLVGLGIPLF